MILWLEEIIICVNFMTEKKATLYFLFATFLWGMTFVFIKKALMSVNPYTFIFDRFLLGAVFLTLINPVALKKINRILLKNAFILSLLLFGCVLFQTIGLQYVDASIASFITGTAVVYVILLIALTTKTWPTGRNVVAVILAMTGLGFVTLHHSANASIPTDEYGWIILCSICFGFYIFIAKKITQQSPIMPLMILQFFMISAFALVFVLLHHDNLYTPTSFNAVTSILYCGIFASGLAFTLQLNSQKVLSPQKISVLFAMEPIFATFAAVIMLHEQLTHLFFVGSGLILCAIVMIQ